MQQRNICVSSELANLSAIASFVSEQARQAGMDEDAVFDIQMAVDEACTNAIQHAYGGRADGQLEICCQVCENCFCISIVDHGQAFDPDAVPTPDITIPLEERDIGGLGLFFMRRLMDKVEFTSLEGGGNRVTLTKRRAPVH